MSGRRRGVWAVALAGLAADAGLAALVAGEVGVAEAVSGFMLVAALLVVGLVSALARPANPTGVRLLGCGWLALLWVLPLYGEQPLVAASAWAFHNVWEAVLVHIFVAFPSQRLRRREDRLAVGGVYAFALVFTPAALMFAEPDLDGCDRCPGVSNPLFVGDLGGVGGVLAILDWVFTFALAAWIVSILVRRWRRATPPQRRVLAPVLAGILVAAVAEILLNLILVVTGDTAGRPDERGPLLDLVTLAYGAAFAAVPLGSLVGLLRTRVTRSSMGELMVALGNLPRRGSLRDVLAQALGDPSLQIAYWLPREGRYVDSDGRPIEPREASESVAVTTVKEDEDTLALLVHDPALLDDEGLVEAASAAARLALENERLHAEVRAQLANVHESRARIVQAGDDARRRIERDLHDGAQQQLVTLSVALRLLDHELSDNADPQQLRELVERASTQADRAMADLRDLARGLYPPVLTDQGLEPALRTLAREAVVPVELEADLPGRLPVPVEVAAYFVCSEAIVNAAKHAQASRVTIRCTTEGDRLRVEVRDDGVGGAVVRPDGGLGGLVDRVEAVGGRLEITTGEDGTCLSATMPARVSADAPGARAR